MAGKMEDNTLFLKGKHRKSHHLYDEKEFPLFPCTFTNPVAEVGKLFSHLPTTTHSLYLTLRKKHPPVNICHSLQGQKCSYEYNGVDSNLRSGEGRALARWSSSRLFQTLLPRAFCETSKTAPNAVGGEEDNSANVEDSLPGVQVKRSQRVSDESRQDTSVSPMEINQWIEAESGMDRLKSAYTLGQDAKFVNEDTRTLTTMLYRTVLVAFFVNAFSASQKKEKKEKYLSRTEAAVKGAMREKAVPINMFKEALRVTLRMSVSAVTVFHLPHIIATYRNETTMWEFALSAGLACGFMGRGLRGFLTMTLSGSIFGIVGGYFITDFLMHHGLSQEQRHLERVKQQILEARGISQTPTDSEVL